MIKLIQNELIKIFKRKSVYFLLFLSAIAIIVYNNINPDQNQVSLVDSTQFLGDISEMEKVLETMNDNIDDYIIQKVSIDYSKLYTSFNEDSWQRYALNEEDINTIFPKTTTSSQGYNSDIYIYLKTINDYELNPDAKKTKEVYENSKTKYNEYVEKLDADNWKDYISLKIKNLEERKNTENFTDEEINEIDFEREVYQLRLKYNINFGYNMLNQYLKEYKSNFYLIRRSKEYFTNESQAFTNKSINTYMAKMNLCKYAIENNLDKDISNETNIILRNKIDARISFIRTFQHFDLIIVIIAIYLSTTIVTEEMNKKTIKKLLTKPHKRSAILFAKIIACIITIMLSMLFVVIVQFIIGGFIFGFDSYHLNYIGYDYYSNQILVMNIFKYIMLVGIFKLPMYIIITIFCVLIGTINNHTSMSMILTLIIFLISSTVLSEWSKVEALSVITRYFITNNWDFSIYLFGQTSDIAGITTYSSILIYFVYLIALLYLSVHSFNKKEINNV